MAVAAGEKLVRVVKNQLHRLFGRFRQVISHRDVDQRCFSAKVAADVNDMDFNVFLLQAKVFGHFVPMSTSDGVNLWMGNNPHSTGSYLPLPASVGGLSEYDQNKILSEDALLYISEHPVEFVSRIFI